MISIITTTIIIIIAFVYLRAKAVDAVSFSSIITTTTTSESESKAASFQKSKKAQSALLTAKVHRERKRVREVHTCISDFARLYVVQARKSMFFERECL